MAMKKTDFKNIMEELGEIKMQLTEDFMFNEAEPQYAEGGENMPQGEQPQQGESEEEKAMHAQEVVQHEPIIAKIREIAIDGLKKYANYPTSSVYAFFKKVFQECDRVITDNGK